jgi:hypothetical protein
LDELLYECENDDLESLDFSRESTREAHEEIERSLCASRALPGDDSPYGGLL